MNTIIEKIQAELEEMLPGYKAEIMKDEDKQDAEIIDAYASEAALLENATKAKAAGLTAADIVALADLA